MPITYRIDTPRRVVFTTATGVLTGQDLMAHKQRLLQDPEFRPGLVELSDIREVETLEITPADISRFVQQDAADAGRLAEYKLAIVASEAVVFGMARMYQMRTQAAVPNVGVFRTMEEADAFLGLTR